jgi:hypothetical protein
MPHKLVVVHTTAGLGPAAIIKAALEAAGIPAETSQEGAGAAFGFTVGPLGLVEILVPDTHAAQAEEIIAAMRRGDLGEEPDNETPP